jgi:hypothetical protein
MNPGKVVDPYRVDENLLVGGATLPDRVAGFPEGCVVPAMHRRSTLAPVEGVTSAEPSR